MCGTKLGLKFKINSLKWNKSKSKVKENLNSNIFNSIVL